MVHEIAPRGDDEPLANESTSSVPGVPARRPRVWPAIVLIALYWAVALGIGWAELPIYTTFMSSAGALMLLTLAFPIWWLTNGTFRGRDRLLVLAVLVAGGAAASAAWQSGQAIFSGIFTALPIVFTVWTGGLLIARWRSPRAGVRTAMAAISLVWFVASLTRIDGINGDGKAQIRWRWNPSAEEIYLAERRAQASDGSAATAVGAVVDGDTSSGMPLELATGDWPAFRGPEHNSQVHGTEISTDWTADPPELVWKQKIGPGWSSMTIIGNRLFTQEQIGESEATIALEASTGRRLWSHEDATRFWDAQSGAGPRATPTFANGRLYTQGATGRLNCLDAATGHLVWSRDIAEDSNAPRPMWGFSSSPLVVDDLVIAYSGGQPQALLAYAANTGKPVWNAAAGAIGYSSPQLETLAGEPQVLLLTDLGLMSVEPQSGKVLWQYEANGHGVWRATQPAALGGDRLLIGSEDLGLVLLEIKRGDSQEGEPWTVTDRWTSSKMRPAFNDFVVADGFIYGFDGGVFCCVDAQDGKRRWRKGRYGHGQVLLLADQSVLLITSETGEAILAEAKPRAFRELAKIQAIAGKTWNHPVVARGCLYVRNDEEIACYRLTRVGDNQLAAEAMTDPASP